MNHINCPICKRSVPEKVAFYTNGFCIYHRRINYEQPLWDKDYQDSKEFVAGQWAININ